MKLKQLFTLLCVAALATPSLALGLLGPPKATLEKGKIAATSSFTRTENDVKIAGPYFAAELSDVKTTDYDAGVAFGLTDSFTMKLFGGSSMPEHTWFEAKRGYVFGAGGAVTIWQKGDVSLGVAALVSLQQSDLIIHWSHYLVEARWLEVVVAPGVTYDVPNLPVSIYGGPCLYVLDGDLDVRLYSPSAAQRWEIHEEDCLGVFCGGVWQVNDRISINAEFMTTNGTQTLGVGCEVKL